MKIYEGDSQAVGGGSIWQHDQYSSMKAISNVAWASGTPQHEDQELVPVALFWALAQEAKFRYHKLRVPVFIL